MLILSLFAVAPFMFIFIFHIFLDRWTSSPPSLVSVKHKESKNLLKLRFASAAVSDDGTRMDSADDGDGVDFVTMGLGTPGSAQIGLTRISRVKRHDAVIQSHYLRFRSSGSEVCLHAVSRLTRNRW